jgi:replicative DNA helicase
MWIVAMMARLDLWRLRNGLLSDREYGRLAGALGPAGDLPLIIAESPNLEMARVAKTAREMHAMSGIQLLILDGFDGTYRSDGGSVSHDLYLLARELAVPIVVTAEIKPTVERRPDRRPLVVDMPDASLADEADCVLMLYRDEHYFGSRSEKPGIVEVAVLKNRLGPRDVVDLAWDERGFMHELATPFSNA